MNHYYRCAAKGQKRGKETEWDENDKGGSRGEERTVKGRREKVKVENGRAIQDERKCSEIKREGERKRRNGGCEGKRRGRVEKETE